jgi:hypothetical protein
MLVDLDGQIAVVWGEENGRVAMGRLTGDDFSMIGENSLSGMPVCGLAALPSSPAVAVAATCAGEIFVLRQDGGILWQAQTQGRGTAYQPVVADLNPTGHEKTAYQPLMADLNSHTGVDVHWCRMQASFLSGMSRAACWSRIASPPVLLLNLFRRWEIWTATAGQN